MIRLTLYILLAICISLGAAWISSNPGEVLISWQGWEVRFTVAVSVLLVILYTFALFTVIWLLKWLNIVAYFTSPERLAAKRAKANLDLDKAWSAYALEDYTEAIKHGRRAKAKLGDDHNVLRLLASATRKLGEDNNPYLDILKKSDMSATWVEKQELDQLLESKSWSRANLLVTRMLEHYPKNPKLLKLKFLIHARLCEWKDAKTALDVIGKVKGAMDSNTLKRNRAVIDYCLAQEAKAAGHKNESHSLLKSAIKCDPSFSAAALASARAYIEQDDKKSAEKVVQQVWKYAPTTELGELFTELYPIESATETYRRVKKLTEMSSAPTSNHLRAEAAINAEKWPDARSALEALVNDEKSSKKTYLLFALLERKQKNDTDASDKYMQKAETAPTEPQWQCSSCKEPMPHYHPICSHCGEFDSIR